MTAFYNQQEIFHSLNYLVKEYLAECKDCKELPEDFIDLLKHNFLAKFVYLDKENNNVEIGVEEFNSEDKYTTINVYTYSLDNTDSWLTPSHKAGNNDLAFYGKLLQRNKAIHNANVVVY